MAEVTLELVGAQLGRLLDGQRRILETLDDVRLRLAAVESGLIAVRRELVDVQAGIARLDHRLDRLEARAARIERRLDPVEG